MARAPVSLVPCALIGLSAGMRTFMPLAAAGWALQPRASSTRAATALAAGELLFDKLPQAPSRLVPSGLAARAITSGVAGGALRGVPGAAAGTLTAMAATPAAHHARRALGRSTGTPDPILGAVEDVLAIALAGAALRLL